MQWLTGVHKSEGIEYFKKESYEDLLWWLQLPCLFTLGAQTSPDRAKIAQMTKTVLEAREAAENAGYRVDVFLGQDEPEKDADDGLTALKTETATPETEAETEKKSELEESVAAAETAEDPLELAGEKLKDE